MALHTDPHPWAGQWVRVVTRDRLFSQDTTTAAYRVQDWWDRVSRQSWMNVRGNPACIAYAMRAGIAQLPYDDEVIYGHTLDGLGHLVHISEVSDLDSAEAQP